MRKEGQSNCNRHRLKSLLWTSRNGGLELNRVWYSAFADGDKGCDKGFLIHPELHIRELHISEESISRAWTERFGKQYCQEKEKKAKSDFEEHDFRETTEQHGTPFDYRSVKTGRCAAVFIHSKAMMTSKMKLHLLQLLRRDILLLLSHTWA